MSATNGAIEHGEWCGVNPQTDCPRCRERTIKLRHMEQVKRELEKMGITIPVLGELLWLYYEDFFLDRIADMAKKETKRQIRKLRVYFPVEDE